MRFTDAQAAPIKAEWETQKTQITGVLHRAIVLTCIALVLFVFLLFVTGRKPEDEDMHLVTIDRLPAEVNVLCFWAVLGTAGGLNLALMGELLNGTNDMSILLVPSILFFVAAFAFALELTLSLVRVIKNRSFVKQCWSIRFILWCWRTFIKVCKCIRQSFGKLRRMLFRDYKTRNVVLLFTAYSIVLAFLAAVFGGVGGSFFAFVFGTVWFLAAGYFLIKRITGFERIVDALRRLRSGSMGMMPVFILRKVVWSRLFLVDACAADLVVGGHALGDFDVDAVREPDLHLAPLEGLLLGLGGAREHLHVGLVALELDGARRAASRTPARRWITMLALAL